MDSSFSTELVPEATFPHGRQSIWAIYLVGRYLTLPTDKAEELLGERADGAR